ncbi:MAG: phosphotransferase [Gammaproteobacteria bacterium]|nr:phosphotransferase [Gammaproteobacteria bacterium]
MSAGNSDPLTTIAAAPPDFAPEEAQVIVLEQYGLEVQARPLVSERDQNFRLVDAGGAEFVLKIANSAEDPDVTRFQIEGLMYLHKSIRRLDLDIRAPGIIPTSGGDPYCTLDHAGQRHMARVVTYLPGVPLSSVPLTPALCRGLGKTLASLAKGLAGFSHVGANQSLLWDMKRALDLRRLLQFFDDPHLRQAVSQCLDDFGARALPVLDGARAQVIHNDLHGDNVLVQAYDAEIIAGVIDFGDMLYSPLIIDLGVAAAYLHNDNDPLLFIESLVAGYDSETPLLQDELDVLVYLVKARLAATIAIHQWRASARAADDPYRVLSQQSAKDAYAFLQLLNTIPVDDVRARLRAACA